MDDVGTTPATSLIARFTALHAALHPERETWNTAVWLRFAAHAAVLRPEEPRQVAHAIRTLGDGLRGHAPWWGALATPMRFVAAALLLQVGGTVRELSDEVERTRRAFQYHGLRCGGGYDVVSALVAHVMNGPWPLSALQVARVAELQRQMKRRHWWLTGRDDLPACVLLSFRDGTAEEIAAEADDLYRRLERAGFGPGDPLQTAANLLTMLGIAPADAVERFTAIARACAAEGMELLPPDHEPIAQLCLLEHEPAVVATRCREYRDCLAELDPPLSGTVAFTVAADLAFLDLVRCERDGSPRRAPASAERMLQLIHLHHAIATILAADAAREAYPLGATPIDMSWPFAGV